MRNVDLVQSVHDRIVQARVSARLFGSKLREAKMLLGIDRSLTSFTTGSVITTAALQGSQTWAIVTAVSFGLGQVVRGFRVASSHDQYEKLRRSWVRLEAELMAIQGDLEVMTDEELDDKVYSGLVAQFRMSEQKIMLLQEMEPPLSHRDEVKVKAIQSQVESELDDKREPPGPPSDDDVGVDAPRGHLRSTVDATRELARFVPRPDKY
ncbi:hypothetical protein [Nannocystis punicea]|uniref:SMODS and SLOG-associating 2TM effector domain-containing protein n=1 Tax=Nannocystis punicea TaxID=2995304 RepID=A0ABY7GZX2_9BACT|nr:hypothetical protein [Nannocystis poenicansa]WAS92528.1 hypothetical protein O0S08_40630 [Nannocystis poenicansa]